MAAVTSLIIVKRFTYRDDSTEEWSNRYYLRNAPPGDAASWKVLADDLIAAERVCYAATSVVVRALGYNDDAPNAHSVWDHDYAAAGTSLPGEAVSTGHAVAGDQAALVVWKTDRKNSRGKWIYLRKYFHDGFTSTTDRDRLADDYKVNLATFASELDPNTGGLHGGIRSRTHADGIVGEAPRDFITTRTLKRRGKRPLARA